jgi:hypothetical protein
MSASTFDDALRDLGAAPPLGRIDPLPSLRGPSPLADLPRDEWPRHYASSEPARQRTRASFLDEVHRACGPDEVFALVFAADSFYEYRTVDAARLGPQAPWRALRRAACALPEGASEAWIARAKGLSASGREDVLVAFEADRLLPSDSALRMLTAAPAAFDLLLDDLHATSVSAAVAWAVSLDLFRRFGACATKLITSCWSIRPADVRATVTAVLPLDDPEVLAWAVRLVGAGADAELTRYGDAHPAEMLAALRQIHPQQSPLFAAMYPIGTEQRIAKKDAWIAELERRLASAAPPAEVAAVRPARACLPPGRPVNWADDPWEPERHRSPLDAPSTRAWLAAVCTQPTIDAALAAVEPLRDALLAAPRDAGSANEGLAALAADVFHGWMFREAPTRTKQVGPLGVVAAFGDAALVVEVGQYLQAAASVAYGGDEASVSENIFAQRQPLARRFLDALAGARRRLAVEGFAEFTLRAVADRPNQTGKYAQALLAAFAPRTVAPSDGIPERFAMEFSGVRLDDNLCPIGVPLHLRPEPQTDEGLVHRNRVLAWTYDAVQFRRKTAVAWNADLVERRARKCSDFLKFLSENGLWGRTLARRVLWASYEKRSIVPKFTTVTHGDENYAAVFRVDESGAFVDLRERPFDVARATHIGLVPFATMSPEDQVRAADLFADYRIHPLVGMSP